MSLPWWFSALVSLWSSVSSVWYWRSRHSLHTVELVHTSPFAVRFDEPILESMAEEERRQPVLPIILSLLEGRVYVVCQTAVDAFRAIYTTIGGPNEIQRAEVCRQT